MNEQEILDNAFAILQSIKDKGVPKRSELSEDDQKNWDEFFAELNGLINDLKLYGEERWGSTE